MDDKKIDEAVDEAGARAKGARSSSPQREVLFNFRLPEALRDACKAAAERDGRTMSSTMRVLIEDYLAGGRRDR